MDENELIKKYTDMLRRLFVGFIAEEAELADAVEKLLRKNGISYRREARIEGGRTDFLLDGGIAIEIKKARAGKKAIEQIKRYSLSDSVRGIILLSKNECRLPEALNGKPCASVSYGKAWGVTLL